MFTNIIHVRQGFINLRWSAENLRVRKNADDTAQNEFGVPDESAGAVGLVKPSLEFRVIHCVHTLCIYENVNVDQDHADHP